MRKFLLGALAFVLSLSFLYGQSGEINYTKILQNSREIFKSQRLKQDCLTLLKKDDLHWIHRSYVQKTLTSVYIHEMTPTDDIKEMWLSIEKYHLHDLCYLHLDIHTYSFVLVEDEVNNPYLNFLFREIDFLKAQCDSLKVDYDDKLQTSIRRLGHPYDLEKYQKLIDQYHNKHNKLPTINEIGREDIHDFYNVFNKSDQAYILKYIDEIKDLEKEKLFSPKYLAKIEDRLRYLDNEPSIYGTIMRNEGQPPYPIEDIQNLNNRRMEMGLYPLGSTTPLFLDLLKHYKIK